MTRLKQALCAALVYVALLAGVSLVLPRPAHTQSPSPVVVTNTTSQQVALAALERPPSTSPPPPTPSRRSKAARGR